MAYTIKPLGKIFTLSGVAQDIILWLRKETQQELDPDFVYSLINLAVMDVAEILSGVGSDDYGKTAVISDQAASATTTIVQNATYTDVTRNVLKTTHGLAAADVGKRIAIWIGTTRAAIAEIESITDVDNFIITKALGGNGAANYAVFSAHSSTTVDLSQYQLSNITKITDSINHEIVKAGDKEFDNLYRFDTKKNKIYYFKHGQTLFFKIGENIAQVGTWTLFFNGYPQKTVEKDDNLDIRDMYAPLYIAKAKNYCLEHLNLQAPESLTSLIDSKTKEVRENILREKGIIEQKNQKGREN